MNNINAYYVLRLFALITFILTLISMRLKFKPYNSIKKIEGLDTINKNDIISQILINLLVLFAVFFIIIMTLLYPAPPTSLNIINKESNFVPLVVISELIRKKPFIEMAYNIIGNIVLFIPIGFLLPLKNRKFKKFTQCLMVGFCFSIGIELCQLLLPHRQTDIDDVLLNTLGVVVGYYMYNFYRKFVKDIVNI